MLDVKNDTQDVAQELASLRKVLDVGPRLHASRTRDQMLNIILTQARDLTHAQAGSLYLVRDESLRFVAAQNAAMEAAEISRHLLGQDMPITAESLAGYVAMTGVIMNIPDSLNVSGDAPFRINREFDTRTGYRARSILAIPLNCPNGVCVGVLELFNRLGEDQELLAFPAHASEGLMSLASTAAIMLHNIGLQEQLHNVHLNTIFRLSTIAEYRDADTGNHVQRVSRTSERLASAMGLEAPLVELIKCASPMHDVGKVAIPDAILLKPGHLTSRQRKIMEKHTTLGAAIFDNPEDEVTAMARDIALYHHERWDGQGYPNELIGEAIPLPGRIVGLADVFDAVVSRRCYKAACSLDVALNILEEDTGKHFDPAVVKAFMSVLDKVLESYPSLKAA